MARRSGRAHASTPGSRSNRARASRPATSSRRRRPRGERRTRRGDPGPRRRDSRGGRSMSGALDRQTIEAADPQSMLGDVLAQPLQLGDALWRAQSAGIGKRDRPGGLVVCGMGGSAIGGDLAAAALGDRATRPITTVRGYAIESWTGPDSLVLCCSYSGDTEETLACFEAAGVAGAGRVVVTTGGQLAEAARAEGVPVIGIPAGMQPRAAVIYMIIGTLECAALCGAAPALHSEIDTSSGLLEGLVAEWGPEASETSDA